MLDKLNGFFAQCEHICQLADAGELVAATESWQFFQTELELFFSGELVGDYSIQQLSDFEIYLNAQIVKLSKKKNEIKQEISSIAQVRSNRVTKRYLTK